MRTFVPTEERNPRRRESIDELSLLLRRKHAQVSINRFAIADGFPPTMKIHEYQAKAILSRHGVPVPRGEVAFSAVEAGDIARRLATELLVIKAQIHAGGRGKGGGVKLARSPEEAEAVARE